MVFITVLVLVAKALLDRIRGRSKKYDGLLSIVSFSSRLIAGTLQSVDSCKDHTTEELWCHDGSGTQ